MKYMATAPDGTVFTRNSDRVYTYAVLRRVDPRAKSYSATGVWLKPEFRGSLEGALSLVTTHSKCLIDPETGFRPAKGATVVATFYSDIVIVPVSAS